VDLTKSFEAVVGPNILDRYQVHETRNAAAIFSATNELRFQQVLEVLNKFSLTTSDLLNRGGNESDLASRLNSEFRNLGWREARVDTLIRLQLRLQPFAAAGETVATERASEVLSEGYKVDNIADRVALDVEWNAKDGNLDRDISAYRALYDTGLIDCAVIITRSTTDLKELARELGKSAGMTPNEAKKILATSTTTNIDKLLPRLMRGDSGGCPVLVAAICARTLRL
jgi:hypothetical protein